MPLSAGKSFRAVLGVDIKLHSTKSFSEGNCLCTRPPKAFGKNIVVSAHVLRGPNAWVVRLFLALQMYKPMCELADKVYPFRKIDRDVRSAKYVFITVQSSSILLLCIYVYRQILIR